MDLKWIDGRGRAWTLAGPPPVNPDLLKRTRNLLGGPRAEQGSKWYSISAVSTVNAAGGKKKTSAEILIYDFIDPWGVDAGTFANDLNALEVDEIVVGINSPGGIVFDGIAIMNALKRHPAKVISRIDGLAASAASFIAMAGDEIQTSKYAEMMIHEARGVVMGTAEEMKEMQDLLVRHNESIASVYADRAGGEVKDWLKLMKNETWFTADEMVAAGLADTVIESSEADEAEAMKNQFDLTVFNYAGRRAAPAPATTNVGTARPKKGSETMDWKKKLGEKFGIDPTLDDEAFQTALDEKLAAAPSEPAPAEGNQPPQTDPAPAPAAPATSEPAPSESELSAAAAVLQRAGMVAVVGESLTALQAQSAQGAQAFEAMAAENDARTVEDAIRAGKIMPANRDGWIENLKLDRQAGGKLGYAEALKNAAAVFPVQEIGHGYNPDPGAQMSAGGGADDLGWFDSAPLEPASGSAND